jgi:pimeloyl-ACP methyl ester carboxylesterase
MNDLALAAVPTLHHTLCADVAVPGAADASGQQHRVAWWQWGAATAGHVVVCVHGLTRQGRDFDALAQALVRRAPGALRVVSIDVAGRGASEWLRNPQRYQVTQYASDALTVLHALHTQGPIARLDWVGTSMGGLIGLVLLGGAALGMTASPLPCGPSRLVLNDVGPALQWAAIERIGQYVGQTGRFSDVQQAADAMWRVSQGFGPHTPEQWLALSRPMLRCLPDGQWTLHYDPDLAVPFKAATPQSTQQGEAALWALYDALGKGGPGGGAVRTLVLRGALSDLLSAATATEMSQRGPKATVHELPGVGHAPTLVAADQVQRVADWLLG